MLNAHFYTLQYFFYARYADDESSVTQPSREWRYCHTNYVKKYQRSSQQELKKILKAQLKNSRGSKYKLTAIWTEPATFVIKVTKQHDVVMRHAVFRILVSARAVFWLDKNIRKLPSA